MIAVAQSGEASQEPSNLLEQIAAEPALLQLVVLALVAAMFWVVLSRMAHAVREARSRAATRDFLLGVEQALHGDPKQAASRLERVLSEDPENTTARLYYALALADLGRPGEAHKHHVQLTRGFGVESMRNRTALAESLLETGRAGEAAEVATAVASRHGDDLDVRRLLLRSHLAAGNQREAGDAALRLARLLPAGDERRRVEGEGARAFAMAARIQVGRGDHATARRLLEQAARCRGDLPETRRTGLAIEFAEHGDETVRRLLGGAPIETENSLLPVIVDAPNRDLALLAQLAPSAPYLCTSCDAPLDEPAAVCRHCGVEGRVVPSEPGLIAHLDSPVHVIDAIEENRAHVQRVLRRLEDGDSSAESELTAIGSGAVEEILARAVERGPDDDVFLPVLQRMGPAILPPLFEAYRRRKEDWLARFGELLGRRSASAVVGRVVQSFGRAALPQFDELLDSADRELRKVIIDFYIGLADQAEFQKILERFPPVEIVRRLERSSAEVLQRFVASVEPGSFQAEVLLTEPAFTRDVDVFLSITSDGGDAAESILARRGFSRTLARELVGHLADSVRGPVADRLLDGFGASAADVEVAAYTDLDRDSEVRERLRSRLRRGQPAAVESLCECLGATPSPLDDEVCKLLVEIGEAAVDVLVEAYQEGTVLEKFAGPLISRHSHRRSLIVRTLGRIGGKAAKKAVTKLRKAETDSNLKLRLDQALHRIQAGPDTEEDAHGQVG